MESIEWLANSMPPGRLFHPQQSGPAFRDCPPAGWKAATASQTESGSPNRIEYPVKGYEILMNSPLIAAPPSANTANPDVTLDVIADNEAELAATPSRSQRTSGWSSRQ